MKFNKAEIISLANNRPNHIRYGQAIFNICYTHFPKETDQLRGSNIDLFYVDKNVDIFLNDLENIIKE